ASPQKPNPVEKSIRLAPDTLTSGVMWDFRSRTEARTERNAPSNLSKLINASSCPHKKQPIYQQPIPRKSTSPVRFFVPFRDRFVFADFDCVPEIFRSPPGEMIQLRNLAEPRIHFEPHPATIHRKTPLPRQR